MNIDRNTIENSSWISILIYKYNVENQNKLVENFDSSIIENNQNNIKNSQKICMQSPQNMNNNYTNMRIINNDWKKSLSCNPNSNFAPCDNNNTNSYTFRLPPLNFSCDRCQTRKENIYDNCPKKPKNTCEIKKRCEKKNSCPYRDINNINSSCYMANKYDMRNNCHDVNDCAIKNEYKNKYDINMKYNHCKNNILEKKECFGGDIGNIIPQLVNNTNECKFSSTPNSVIDKLYADVTTYNNDSDPNGETGVVKCSKECDGACVEYGETGVTHCYHPYKETTQKLNGGIRYFSDNDVSRPQQLLFPDLR
jgi:hypothetical protein